jgi:cobalamin biosynthesis protein CobW
MQSAVLRLDGSFDRAKLEAVLNQQIAAQGLLRLKGRAWLAGKSVPLQIQAVGLRLECWFDAAARQERPGGDGLELVLLGLQVDTPAMEKALLALLER